MASFITGLDYLPFLSANFEIPVSGKLSWSVYCFLFKFIVIEFSCICIFLL